MLKLNSAVSDRTPRHRWALVVLLGVGCAAVLPAAWAATGYQPPVWPQNFNVAGQEAAGFGFPVTQPGAIQVDVQSSGAPVIVTLRGAAAQPIQQVGSGPLHLTYQVQPQNVQAGLVWSLQIKLAQPGPNARASGTVTVHAPPADAATVQAALQKHVAVAGAQRDALHRKIASSAAPAPLQMQVDAAFNAHKAQFAQQRQAELGQAFNRLRPLAQQAQARMQGAVGTRALPRAGVIGVAPKQAEIPSGAIKQMPPATASSAQAIEAVGQNPPPQTVVANPVIASLSAAQGRPGDPIMISGSGFSSGGAVHFVIGGTADLDLSAPVQVWTDTQLFVTVPTKVGVLGFNGVVYVVRDSDKVKSNLLPFQFQPLLAHRQLTSSADRSIGGALYAGNMVLHDNGNPFGGNGDNDQLFTQTHVSNTWVVEGAQAFCDYQDPIMKKSECDGGVNVAESRTGSSDAYTKVHWWAPPAPLFGYSETWYTFAVYITGPWEVPDGVACKQTPCNDK